MRAATPSRWKGIANEAFIFATTVGVIATVGVFASYLLDFPTGPTIVAILAAIFALSYGYAALRPN